MSARMIVEISWNGKTVNMPYTADEPATTFFDFMSGYTGTPQSQQCFIHKESGQSFPRDKTHILTYGINNGDTLILYKCQDGESQDALTARCVAKHMNSRRGDFTLSKLSRGFCVVNPKEVCWLQLGLKGIS